MYAYLCLQTILLSALFFGALKLLLSDASGSYEVLMMICSTLSSSMSESGTIYGFQTCLFLGSSTNALSNNNCKREHGREIWVHCWLENTIEKEIWHEAVEKQHYLATDTGFTMVDRALGNNWVNELIRTMLREMRTVLFVETHLCQPQQMTNKWARTMNLLYHKDHQDADPNLFACMSCPPVQEHKLMPGNLLQYLKGTGGKTADHINVIAAEEPLQ
ncbi:hypothetical protein EV702DRAFT_1049043 [Suillus placidus]|uniref:Uncharacterized protein n=1 Tax=Suillus placidus TaxID=48579 RepID=A0A9P6ZLW2_9AGAM|nr:hypothetical protein EV702DRAFT_1049043 [Suillus placidus]